MFTIISILYLIVGISLSIYLFLPRVYFWLSFDGYNFILNIKNTSKIGATIKILNWKELKETIDNLQQFKKGSKWKNYNNQFEGEINIPPEETVSRPLGFHKIDVEEYRDFNEFTIIYDYKFFKYWFFETLFPMKEKKKNIYFHNLKRASFKGFNEQLIESLNEISKSIKSTQ
jgi:hypothetical protein